MKIKNRKSKGTKRNRISLRSKCFVHDNALDSLNSTVKNNTGNKEKLSMVIDQFNCVSHILFVSIYWKLHRQQNNVQRHKLCAN